jgi:glycosyltransferase involved in cell wall biosynthesis
MNHVTVVICNYNYEHDLAAAIDSALAQDYPATRVLVVDDGSTDGSRAVIEQYGTRVSAIYKENGGQVSAYNQALEIPDTEYVIFLDSDEILYPTVVSEVMSRLSAGPWAKVQFRLDVMDGAGTPTGAHIPNAEPTADGGKPLRGGWLYPSPHASGNAYRVSALRAIFPVPEEVINRYGAALYAIYGAALLGPVATISFCSPAYPAPLASRWRWLLRNSGSYLQTIVTNRFGRLNRKMSALVLSGLVPYRPLSDFLVRYISNTLAPRRMAGHLGPVRASGGRYG